MMKGSIHSGDIIILNVDVPNYRVPKCMKQKLIEFKQDIDRATIISGDFIIPLSVIQKSNKK